MSSHRNPNILVIDNDDQVTRLVSMFLERNGYSCTTARTGAQGVSEFKAGSYELVITDLNMPMGDGMAVVEEIRQVSKVPIIILTGFRREYADRVRYLRNVTILTKPYSSDGLLDLVEAELAAETKT